MDYKEVIRMYDFTQIDETPRFRDMSIQLIVNGVNLDRTLYDFTTLTVTGRELIGRNIKTQDFESITGGGKQQSSRNYKENRGDTNKLIGTSLPSRHLKVEFMLKAPDNESFIRECEKLNYYLKEQESRIEFTDDVDFYYEGTFTSIDIPTMTSNTLIATLGFECVNPHKISKQTRSFTFTNKGVFKHKTLYPTVFNKAVITVNETLNDVRLKNTTEGFAILLNDIPLVRGDSIHIDFEEGTIRKNNKQNVMKYLNLRSHLEDYGATYLDEFSCQGCTVELTFKEKRL